MSRSPSMSATALYAENQDLIEQNRNLSLKLRYVQSVNTIFRQRVGTLMQSLTQKIVELQVATNQTVDIGALYAAADESARNSVDPDGNHLDAQQQQQRSETQYWQNRFLDAMSSVQPISQHEVETLCRLIREKVDRDTVFSSPNGVSSSTGSVPRSGSQQQQQQQGNATYAASVAAEVLSLREKLELSESRCKSLFHRLSGMRKKQDDEEQERSHHSVSLTTEVGNLTAATREMKARLTEQEALNRRLTSEINVLRSDRNLQNQHLSRMQGMCAAVMRESQCAVNEGLAATQMNETALLKRQMDTFELVLRKTELELNTSRKQCDEKDTALAEKERALHSLQLRMDSKEKTLDLYRSRCEAMATAEKDQREEQTRALQSLSSRMSDAVGDLSSAFTTKGIASGLENLNATTEKFAATLAGPADEMTKQYSSMRASYVALVEEMTMAAKGKRTPRLDAVSNEAARVLLGEIKFPREAVLRTSGDWSEVRDLNNGNVFYTTNEISKTPFDPAGTPPVGAPPRPPSPPRSHQPPSPPRAEEPKPAEAAAAAAAEPDAKEPSPSSSPAMADLEPPAKDKTPSPSPESAAAAAAADETGSAKGDNSSASGSQPQSPTSVSPAAAASDADGASAAAAEEKPAEGTEGEGEAAAAAE